MTWDARQRRMLDAMGIRLWAPARPGVDAGDDTLVEQRADESGSATAPRPRPAAPAENVPGTIAASPSMPAAAAERGPEATEAIGAMDWPALRERVATCTACALCTARTKAVFGAGPAQADWMVVGEAPGEPEDREGESFVGKAGALLDRMLHAIDVSRVDDLADRAHRAFVCNVVRCRPPGDRNPSPDELQRCAPFLRRQVALVRPRIVLALGRFAVQSLLGTDEPIGRLRGRVHRCDGRPLVVSYHPAYLLRNPADKARAWDDLCLARETLLAATAPDP